MAKPRRDVKPTPKMLRLYNRLVEHWGEPTDCFEFDAQELDEPVNLQLIQVLTWAADEVCDVTALNTIGMSAKRMHGACYDSELHLGFRGELDERQRLDLARMLANVAEYPFEHRLKLDWWETITDAGRIPIFTGCRHLLLHPKFVEDGLEQIEDEDGPIKLLYVVPITPYERHRLLAHGIAPFQDYLCDREVDLFADRHDDPRWYSNGE